MVRHEKLEWWLELAAAVSAEHAVKIRAYGLSCVTLERLIEASAWTDVKYLFSVVVVAHLFRARDIRGRASLL